MESIIGIDDTMTYVIGCDPGPEHCAMAQVMRKPDNTLVVIGAAYPHYSELISGRIPSTRFGGFFIDGGISSCFCYEKVTSRYGACPGASTYDTCRNAGIAVAWAANSESDHIFGISTTDWRVALGGRTNLSDAEVRAELTRLLGEGQEQNIAAMAKDLKKKYNLDKPIGCHIRDAVGVAVGAFLMKRRGVPVSEREVWHG